MSAGAVRPFLPALRRLEARLSVPVTRRVRLLRELEYDLEELTARFVDQGMPQPEAQARALDALLPDGDALQELGGLHESLYRRFGRRFGPTRLRGIERGALAAATAVVLAAEAAALLRADLLAHASPFLWVVLGFGAALFALAATSAFSLWVRKDPDVLERGPRGLLAGSALTLMAGFVGAYVELSHVLGLLGRNPELVSDVGVAWLIRICTLLSTSLTLALLGALAWFVMHQWLVVLATARARALGFDSSDSPQQDAPT